MERINKKVAFFYIVFHLFYIPVLSQAGIVWQNNGVGVCSFNSSKNSPVIISDQNNNVIIAWYDLRSGNDCYIQKVDSLGNTLWSAAGLKVCTPDSSGNSFFRLTSNGVGGAFVYWLDSAGLKKIQNIDANGNFTFGPSGIQVGPSSIPGSGTCQLVYDWSGNAIVTWSGLYGQKYNSLGVPQWESGGVTICSEAVAVSGLEITSDNVGNAFITWLNTSGYSVYTQKINISGQTQWTYDGLTICAGSQEMSWPKIIADGSGGAIVAWKQTSGTNRRIFAQKILSNGSLGWTYGGVTVCATTTPLEAPEIISDNAGGAIITWVDRRNLDGTNDIYIARVNSSGTTQWGGNGYGLCTASGWQSESYLTTDGANGAIVSWLDARSGYQVYSQAIDSSGLIKWVTNGVVVNTLAQWNSGPRIASDSERGAVITWVDTRNPQIWAQRVTVVTPTPTITSTTTPTPTVTPIADVYIADVSPEQSLNVQGLNVTILGKSFESPASVKLRRVGYSDILASSVNVSNSNKLTCSFNLSNATPGPYDVQVILNTAYGLVQNRFLVINPIDPPIQWDMSDMGQAGITAQTNLSRGLVVADGNNDLEKEVYSAGLLVNLLQYKRSGSNWDISQLPTGPIGEYYTDVCICDMENDGQLEVYGSTLDHHIYYFSGSNWSARGDSGDLGSAVNSIASGDGDNDDHIEIYGALENGNIYEFGYNGTSWSNSIIGNATGKMLDVAVGDGNQDGANEVYAACEDKNLYQFKYNGSAWAKTIVATGGDDMLSVAVGDGNQDGENEVYCANLDGTVYQCKWSSGFFWNVTQVSTQPSRDVLVGDGDNDGNQEVYLAAINGHVYECEYTGGQWSSQDLGSAPESLYSLALGDGDNDYQLELYALAGDSHVYQFKASHSQPTPTPTKTPVPDFDGQIISKSYVYAAPNPIRGHIAKIHIMTLQPAEVTVKMFTTTNREVMSFNRNYGTGMQIETVNMSNLANGVYFLLVKARAANGLEEKVIKKIALIK